MTDLRRDTEVERFRVPRIRWEPVVKRVKTEMGNILIVNMYFGCEMFTILRFWELGFFFRCGCCLVRYVDQQK